MPNWFACLVSASVLSVIASTALAQSQPAAKPESAPTAVTGITVEGASKPKVIQ